MINYKNISKTGYPNFAQRAGVHCKCEFVCPSSLLITQDTYKKKKKIIKKIKNKKNIESQNFDPNAIGHKKIQTNPLGSRTS